MRRRRRLEPRSTMPAPMSAEPATSGCASGRPVKGSRPPGFGAVGVVGGGVLNVTPNTVGVTDGLRVGEVVPVPPPAGQAGAGAVVGAKRMHSRRRRRRDGCTRGEHVWRRVCGRQHRAGRRSAGAVAVCRDGERRHRKNPGAHHKCCDGRTGRDEGLREPHLHYLGVSEQTPADVATHKVALEMIVRTKADVVRSASIVRAYSVMFAASDQLRVAIHNRLLSMRRTIRCVPTFAKRDRRRLLRIAATVC
jgi:hypothetical protein